MLGIWADDENSYSHPRRPRDQSKSNFNTKKINNSISAAQKSDEIGSWEKHTQGIGSKLLKKMGWKGKGLGKDEQGMVKPIMTMVRGEREGLREDEFVGVEEVSKFTPINNLPVDSKDEDETEEFIPLKRKKTKSKLLSEIAKGFDEPKIIVDMRGPEKRILTNIDQLFSQASNYNENIEYGELKIIQLEQRKVYNDKTIERLNTDREHCNVDLETKKQNLQTLSQVLDIIIDCKDKIESDSLKLDYLLEIFKKLRVEFPEIYDIYSLESLVFHFVYPLLDIYFRNWNPLTKPDYGLSIMKSWKDVLSNDEDMDQIEDPFEFRPSRTVKKLDSYNRLVYEIIIPKIRTAIDLWNTRDPDICINIIEKWSNVMSQRAYDHVLYSLILNKLKLNVEEWNPLTDPTPIHLWIHPWLPYLEEGLKELYDPIRIKFTKALSGWNLSDKSALALLKPWHNIFEKKNWNRMIISSIMPSIEKSMKEFEIDPSNQSMDIWNASMEWLDYIPINHFCSILERYFFSKWFKILGLWLSTPDANYEDISMWYLAWKKQFPKKLLDEQKLKNQFKYALKLMNNAVSGKIPPIEYFVPL